DLHRRDLDGVLAQHAEEALGATMSRIEGKHALDRGQRLAMHSRAGIEIAYVKHRLGGLTDHAEGARGVGARRPQLRVVGLCPAGVAINLQRLVPLTLLFERLPLCEQFLRLRRHVADLSGAPTRSSTPST